MVTTADCSVFPGSDHQWYSSRGADRLRTAGEEQQHPRWRPACWETNWDYAANVSKCDQIYELSVWNLCVMCGQAARWTTSTWFTHRGLTWRKPETWMSVRSVSIDRKRWKEFTTLCCLKMKLSYHLPAASDILIKPSKRLIISHSVSSKPPHSTSSFPVCFIHPLPAVLCFPCLYRCVSQVKIVAVEKKINEIVNRLEKTKEERFPDLAAEKESRDREERNEKKAQLQEQKKREKEEQKRKKEMEDLRYMDDLSKAAVSCVIPLPPAYILKKNVLGFFLQELYITHEEWKYEN